MNAIVLAAGRGKRLRPVTDYVPKPLLPIVNRPVIGIIIAQLRDAGIQRIGINLWYKADQIASFLKAHTDITIAREDELLGTGGALRNFDDFLTTDVVIHNTDVLTSIDVRDVVNVHNRHQPIATLVLTKNAGTDVIQIDQEQRVTEIRGTASETCYTFTGVAVLAPAIASYFPGQQVFSMVDVYQNALRDGQTIIGYTTDAVWYDVGSPRQYWQVHHDLQNRIVRLPQCGDVKQHHIDAASVVRSRKLDGFVTVGPRCHIAEQVHLQDSIVFADSTIEQGDYTRTVISNHFCISV